MKAGVILVLVSAALLSGCRSARARRHPTAEPAGAPHVPKVELRDGDLVFHRSSSPQSAAVALATRSNYTHMGVVFIRDGKPVVFEAVQPVRLTPYSVWVKRGAGGHVVVKRLAGDKLDDGVVRRMDALARSWLGRPYDLQFRWDDERLYCSEVVYKLYERAAGIRIGTLQKAREMDLGSPEVQRKIRERFGRLAIFDPEETVISPQSMFDDPRLVTVHRE